MDGGPTVEETTRDNLTSTKVSQRKRLWSYLGHPCNGNHNLSGEDWLMPALWSLSNQCREQQIYVRKHSAKITKILSRVWYLT